MNSSTFALRRSNRKRSETERMAEFRRKQSERKSKRKKTQHKDKKVPNLRAAREKYEAAKAAKKRPKLSIANSSKPPSILRRDGNRKRSKRQKKPAIKTSKEEETPQTQVQKVEETKDRPKKSEETTDQPTVAETNDRPEKVEKTEDSKKPEEPSEKLSDLTTTSMVATSPKVPRRKSLEDKPRAFPTSVDSKKVPVTLESIRPFEQTKQAEKTLNDPTVTYIKINTEHLVASLNQQEATSLLGSILKRFPTLRARKSIVG